MKKKNYDFSGWATRNDLKCSDGRIIRRNAFKDNDGMTVPLVFNHSHNDPKNVLGHAELENRDEGVYCFGYFNDTSAGDIAKVLVQHGDVTALSIYANHLKQIAHGNVSEVIHGDIKEVSLVLAGANPGASIDTVIAHSDDSGEEAVIYTGESLELYHSDDASVKKKTQKEDNETMADKEKEKETGEETGSDIFNSLNEQQKKTC